VQHTSIFHSSVRHSIAPRPLTASTSSRLGVSATILPNAAMSWPTPVEVSLSVEHTATAFGWSASAVASCSGCTASPYGTLTLTASTPNALHRLRQRSPNLPAIRQIALLPAGRQFATAASSAPVPELVSGMIGLFV